ncbi:MAG TPA: class I SAM-dependent RNA methyltransferase [Acidimicrobiia bacterium]|jgi:23S rRNA (uracil1939-C5)-methyltransferase
MVAGGTALGRLADGRRALIRGALPGEVVRARLTRQQKGVVHADIEEVLEPAPERVEPPCPMVAAGCGGCDWQHIDETAQPRFKRDIVVDALAHIGRLADAPVDVPVALRARKYRTTIRGVATADGMLGLHRTRSHEPVPIRGCLIAHPRLRDVIDSETFTPGREVTLRVATDGTVGRDADTVRMRVHSVDLEVPVRSFFQPHADAPARLAELVRDALGDVDTTTRRLADLYCGVGLFAATVPAASVVAVERDRAASAAAKRNLGAHARVITQPVERADIGPADVVVADPSRTGLGRAGVDTIARTNAALVALVSCDPASFARDARLLTDAGYELERAVPVDQFGNTSHIEVVGRFARQPGALRRARPTASRARRPR